MKERTEQVERREGGRRMGGKEGRKEERWMDKSPDVNINPRTMKPQGSKDGILFLSEWRKLEPPERKTLNQTPCVGLCSYTEG